MSTATHHLEHRGVALLVALIALAMVATLAVGALQRSVNGSTASRVMSGSRQAARLVDDCTPVLLGWAATEAAGVIAQVEDPSRWIPVFDSHEVKTRVQIHAIDCSGRLRTDRLDTFARLGLPAGLQRLNNAAITVPLFREASGLRPLLETYAAALSDRAAINVFSDPTSEYDPVGQDYLADWITTHGGGALNVNTAPIQLLRAALLGLDPADARKVLESRQAGEPVPASLLRSLDDNRTDDTRRLRLSTTSDAYGFLVTIAEGSARQRWWIVAERSTSSRSGSTPGKTYGADPADIGSWRITERRRIG